MRDGLHGGPSVGGATAAPVSRFSRRRTLRAPRYQRRAAPALLRHLGGAKAQAPGGGGDLRRLAQEDLRPVVASVLPHATVQIIEFSVVPRGRTRGGLTEPPCCETDTIRERWPIWPRPLGSSCI